MEGVAEVSKRKALLAAATSELRIAQENFAASKMLHNHPEQVTSETAVLHPLLAKQEEEKERAAAVARAAFHTVKNIRRDKRHNSD